MSFLIAKDCCAAATGKIMKSNPNSLVVVSMVVPTASPVWGLWPVCAGAAGKTVGHLKKR